MKSHSSQVCVSPSRRSFLAGCAGTASLPETLLAAAADRGSLEDERFMRLALDEARQGDFPFGAVIVQDGMVIARGRNLGARTAIPPRTAKWSQSGAVSPTKAPRRCAAARSIRRASLARCAWAQFFGAASAVWFLRRRWRSSLPESIRSCSPARRSPRIRRLSRSRSPAVSSRRTPWRSLPNRGTRTGSVWPCCARLAEPRI
jgi:hypothetical protein